MKSALPGISSAQRPQPLLSICAVMRSASASLASVVMRPRQRCRDARIGVERREGCPVFRPPRPQQSAVPMRSVGAVHSHPFRRRDAQQFQAQLQFLQHQFGRVPGANGAGADIGFGEDMEVAL